MTQPSYEFLFDLLATPSPSGQEALIQRKWASYVKAFCDEIRTDSSGNVIGILNPEAPFKVLLAGHSDEIGFIVRGMDNNGFVYIDSLGGISPKPAIGMKIEILGYKQRIVGVVGVNAEHHGGVKEEFEFSDLYIDCGAKSKEEIMQYVQVGDLAVYKREPEKLLNHRLSARGLDNRTGAFIIAEVLKRCKERNSKVGLYVASTVNEETNMGGAYFAASQIKPTLAIACDVTFATDFPEVDQNKHGHITLDGGPVLAKGAPINHKINSIIEESAKRLNINLQYELTPRMTGTDADRMRLTGEGVPIALVSLPLRYMHAPVETVSFKDIEQEIDLLTDMICHLTGEEDFNPVDL
ncbi:M20/M25/M40 family metallo-hydrolase [Terrilactibacillus laevilacticus]|uniref:M20/M25/M40 family metallo-hydrolase n=1 Tax=Terrilactibacillus laevilacticus TaxID=1380157 RepID=UPI001146FFCD|nr:M20/M25/M40 family metallo-hydrolase [Terrilactibacillus laevilacticus]